MFDDPKRELKRLEEQLLKQEDDRWLDDELAEARQLLDDDYDEEEDDELPVRSYRVSNTDSLDVDLARYSDDVYEEPPKQKGIRGLVILACLETLGIVGIVAYWLLHLL